MSLLRRKTVFEFYYDPSVVPSQNIRCNTENILVMLGHISKKKTGDHEYEFRLKDTGKLSKEEIKHIYLTKAMVPAAMKKYEIEKVFGTKEKAIFFGKEVPVILVYKDSTFGYPSDIYPHIEKNKLITIEDYLAAL